MGNQHAPTPKPPPTPPNGPAIIEALKHLQDNMDARYEMFDHQSRVLRTKYCLLIERGFNEHQALYLCNQDWSNAL